MLRIYVAANQRYGTSNATLGIMGLTVLLYKFHLKDRSSRRLPKVHAGRNRQSSQSSSSSSDSLASSSGCICIGNASVGAGSSGRLTSKRFSLFS